MQDVRGKRIFVGLSGGVDSAVTAALLQHAGADVVGVFIKGWYPEGLPCTWAEDRKDAMRVAAHLRIPFHTLDASESYKESVIEYLVREYGAGRTPNPDIMCNRDVKFGAFYEFAKQHGADLIATGHYARHEGGNLFRGVDPDKDQSYFLWAISPEALAMTRFPLGEMNKAEVRSRARTLGLPNAVKKDSQGICFLGPVSMDDFLTNQFGVEPGSAVDEEGRTIGKHRGALLVTLGERIALADAPPGPWYVLRKDLRNNVLIVGKKRTISLPTTALTLTDTNWFREPMASEVLTAQYRYHGPHVEGTVSNRVFTPLVPITEPVAHGQSLVFYEGDQVRGGGIIA